MTRTIDPRAAGAVLSLACVAVLADPSWAGQARAEALDETSYVEAIEAWHAEREQRLRRPDGWLTLCGLFWLEEGENPFGSGAGNRVVLPDGKAPAAAGSIWREGDRTRVTVSPGAPVTHAGEPVRELDLQSDADGEPTVLETGSISFYVIERGGRLAVRVKDRENAALLGFSGIERYPVSPGWRLDVRFEPYDPPKSVAVADITGHVNDEESPGALVFEVDGEAHRLDVFDASSGYFVVFADATNGRETYGGGRFLVAGPAGADGRLTLDFNKAYNPPCVFTPHATCPLPPPQNRLPVAVTAGEKMYRGHDH